jgi:thioredoxin 2
MIATGHLTADERGVIVYCPGCERANRVPFARLGDTGHCAQCKASLPAPSLPVEISSAAAFTALTQKSALPVLIDFWAPWCGPCKMVAPEVAKLAAMTAGELLVAKVNTEDQPQIGSAMGIRSIPTFAVFNGGREIERASGGMPAAQLRNFAFQALGRGEARA